MGNPRHLMVKGTGSPAAETEAKSWSCLILCLLQTFLPHDNPRSKGKAFVVKQLLKYLIPPNILWDMWCVVFENINL